MTDDSVPPHPALEKLEPWFAQMHVQLFDTLQQAQAAVDEAERTGQDLDVSCEYYQQLQRDFKVTVASFPAENHFTLPMIKRTQALEESESGLRLHLAQVWAAAVCTLTLHRMLSAVPLELADDENITGELKMKAAMHYAMWQHLLSDA
ncbi:hypothetical protein [Alteromonas halophila]|uniref:Uncharacterized protein n=1 Tax=Alteromonas halophila TaxID=516698 RepID=A0A918MYE5_9ALTE|nr:hypothetical protein [Alteromonas halophila]GGW83107.1 hypothetical protein GCM10007391_15490 [Alteromonas halophila]